MLADPIATSLKRLPAAGLPAFLNIKPGIEPDMAVAFRCERTAPPLAASGAVMCGGVYLAERG